MNFLNALLTRLPIAKFLSGGGLIPPVGSQFIVTEGSNKIITESGDLMITEGA